MDLEHTDTMYRISSQLQFEEYDVDLCSFSHVANMKACFAALEKQNMCLLFQLLQSV